MRRLRPAALNRADAELTRCGGCGGWLPRAGASCSTCDLRDLLDPLLTEQQVLDEIERLRLAQ